MEQNQLCKLQKKYAFWKYTFKFLLYIIKKQDMRICTGFSWHVLVNTIMF